MEAADAGVGGGVKMELEPEEAARQARKVKTGQPKKRARAAKKAVAAPAKATPGKVSKRMVKEIPKLEDLRLAPGGVMAHGDRHLDIVFTNGFRVRLFPVNFPKKETTMVRNLAVAWLQKKFSA